MFLAVFAVSGGRPLVEPPVRKEAQTNVEVGVLILDQQMLLSVVDIPSALRLDIEKAALLGQLEVGGVGGLSFRPCVGDLVGLVLDRQASVFYLPRHSLLET